MITTATQFEIELIQNATRKQLAEELLHGIHDIYTLDLHCKGNLCMKETMDYDCTDCLYQSIQALIWQKKFEAANNKSKEETKEETNNAN